MQPSGVHPGGMQPSGVHPGGMQPSGVHPGGMQPPSAIHPAPSMGGAQPYHPQAYSQQPYGSPQQPPAGGGWGWNSPAAPPGVPQGGAGYPYPFYAPGARVQVTWSNGQRYPATVSQVSGPSCLVVFPDGQQHWVEMQYLAPS
jgi:hypothetical protein